MFFLSHASRILLHPSGFLSYLFRPLISLSPSLSLIPSSSPVSNSHACMHPLPVLQTNCACLGSFIIFIRIYGYVLPFLLSLTTPRFHSCRASSTVPSPLFTCIVFLCLYHCAGGPCILQCHICAVVNSRGRIAI